MNYNFGSIPPVLTAEELVNVVLSYVQRKTPTEIHSSFQISRIRTFYMRKIKTAQQVFFKKLSDIIDKFPQIDVYFLIFVFIFFYANIHTIVCVLMTF
jgi:nucleolar GTP-binding protein